MGVKARGLLNDDEDDEAIHYFMYHLNRIKAKAKECANEGKYKNFACYEFTQNAGETVFVPHGWWHAVLNLTDTVAITQNYCSRRNFDAVWKKTRSDREKFAWKWLLALDQHYPPLAQRARDLNERDNFYMKFDPDPVAKQKRHEALQESRSNITMQWRRKRS